MKKRRTLANQSNTPVGVHIFFLLVIILTTVPLMTVITVSLTSVEDIARNGFSIIPKKIDTTSYAYLFANPKQIIQSYLTTIFITIVGTAMSVLIMAMVAYAMARPQYILRNKLAFFIFFPTLFSGGLVSTYIIYTQVYKLTDSIWALILPSLVNPFHVFMIRTFFKELPNELYDAAEVDGAGEMRICFSIAMRLSKPVLATVAFLGALGRWNEWYNAMLYIRSKEKYPLQYLLQRMMMNIQELIANMNKIPGGVDITNIPGENLRMALLVVCIGPMMFLFPFFQKYFVKGMTVGSVKG